MNYGGEGNDYGDEFLRSCCCGFGCFEGEGEDEGCWIFLFDYRGSYFYVFLRLGGICGWKFV